MSWLYRLIRSEDGPTAVEYAVMLAMIVVIALLSIQAAGSAANSSFDHSNTRIQTVTGS